MFFPIFSNVFTNILKIYELPKIYNKLTIIIYQVNSMSQLHLASEISWKCTLGGKRFFWHEIKKTLGRIFFFFFFWKCSAKHSFFFVASDVVRILCNKPCILDINIFGKNGIIQIWIIFSKDINTQCLCKIVKNWDNIWCSLMHLYKSIMRLQIPTFKNCNKWIPVYKG